MVPYMTKRDFPITPDYTVPKGTMLIPSFWNSLHDANVYPDPDAFVPERWLDPKGPAQSNPKEYLVVRAQCRCAQLTSQFGSGCETEWRRPR